MKYYFLEPEVAGGLGEKSVIDSTTHPPKVDKLQYIFSGWLGDAILESFPCVIATQDASDVLQDSQATGVEFADVEVLTSSEFRELYPEGNLPSFKWLKVNGKPGKDDFGIADDLRLVVSARVLKLLQPFGIKHALISDFV